ncbi:3-methyl-2-oxobutanoate hydroxymethyltransferase [Cellulophaga omnivescoria]|uniref:3-methyl-2-oxobutanoate hydroxymethyltransferase n=1 Tax=Cellulophaga omnivescoria TaxID=1888890 RepID=UPI000985E19E|nr:3-methyl-2-oxobutanoate hydroxymethyltransferase [Cellulophaga omnivescoria]WBU91044.1 nuclear transport factor 2 family protein [Cellulophaga omnivescoria]
MKNILLTFAILFSVFVSAQANEVDVKNTINLFFEAFHKQDSVQLKAVATNTVILQTIGADKDGNAVVKTESYSDFIQNIISIPKEVNFKEKLTSYTIKIDGDMANAWTEYEFWLNGKFSHCGVNSFQLFKDNGKWKIIYLIDTRRKKGCN